VDSEHFEPIIGPGPPGPGPAHPPAAPGIPPPAGKICQETLIVIEVMVSVTEIAVTLVIPPTTVPNRL